MAIARQNSQFLMKTESLPAPLKTLYASLSQFLLKQTLISLNCELHTPSRNHYDNHHCVAEFDGINNIDIACTILYVLYIHMIMY